MNEQEYVLKDPECFSLKDIFTCGQCFRWQCDEENEYIGVVGENVIKIKKDGNDYVLKSKGKEDLKELTINYFDLERDYKKIQNTLSKIDENMEKSIKYGQGIRILNQDLWETIISFIISANNNIPRIQKIIQRLSENFGKEIVFENNKYYTFPTPEELKDVSVEKYRE